MRQSETEDEIIISTENQKETVKSAHIQSVYQTFLHAQRIIADPEIRNPNDRLVPLALYAPIYTMDMEWVEETQDALMDTIGEIKSTVDDVDSQRFQITKESIRALGKTLIRCDSFLGFRERQEVMRIPKPEKGKKIDPSILDSFAYPNVVDGDDTTSSEMEQQSIDVVSDTVDDTKNAPTNEKEKLLDEICEE